MYKCNNIKTVYTVYITSTPLGSISHGSFSLHQLAYARTNHRCPDVKGSVLFVVFMYAHDHCFVL